MQKICQYIIAEKYDVFLKIALDSLIEWYNFYLDKEDYENCDILINHISKIINSTYE